MSDKEKIIGKVRVDSGTLLITDGIFNSAGINDNSKKIVELSEDSVCVPIHEAVQNGKRFLIIPIDNLVATTSNTGDIVTVSGLDNVSKEGGGTKGDTVNDRK